MGGDSAKNIPGNYASTISPGESYGFLTGAATDGSRFGSLADEVPTVDSPLKCCLVGVTLIVC